MDATSSRSPLITIAAIAVILFSGVGIATLMGWIPNSQSKVPDSASPLSAASPAGGAAPPVAAGFPPPADAVPAPVAGSAAAAPHHSKHTHLAQAGMPPASDAMAPPAAAGIPPPGAAAVPPPGSAPVAAAPVCADCGTVQSVEKIEHQGQGTGLGAVAGGVLGAVVGHQVGQGNGNTLATLIGAGGGALAGNTVEKNVRKSVSWKVTVAMTDGSLRTFNLSSAPAFAAGQRVQVSNGQLLAIAN